MRIRTSNNNARRALRRKVYEEAYAFDHARMIRLSKSGRLDKRANSRYVRRRRKTDKLQRRVYQLGMLAAAPKAYPIKVEVPCHPEVHRDQSGWQP